MNAAKILLGKHERTEGIVKVVEKAGSMFDRLLSVCVLVICFLLIGSMLIINLEIVTRYFLNRPVSWVVEMAEYSIFIIAFLGAAWLLKHGGHVRIDLLLERVNPRTHLILDIISSIIGAAVGLTLTWYGTLAAWDAKVMNRLTYTALELIQWPFLMVIPIGGFLLFIQFLRKIRGHLGSWSELPE